MYHSHTPDEYKYYFDRNTHGNLYRDVYQRFLNEKTHSRMLIPEAEQKSREARAGYVDGKPKGGGYVAPPPVHYAPQVQSYGVPQAQSYGAPPPVASHAYGAPPAYGSTVPPPAPQVGTTWAPPAPPASSNAGYRPTPTYNNAPAPGSDLPPAY